MKMLLLLRVLRSATESRIISEIAREEYRNRLMKELIEEKFMERTMEGIIERINWNSEHGERKGFMSGCGDRSSPLRCRNDDKYDLMEEIIKYQIIPILKEQGYYCKVERHHFASNEKYFTITFSW